MPLPLSHSLLGASVVAAALPLRVGVRRARVMMLAGALAANLADFDFALVWLYGSKEWHRGFTHSLAFALIFGLALGLLGRRVASARELVALALAYASHALLDYATTLRGGGVELLWPASDARHGLRLFGLSETPSQMTVGEIALSLLAELLIFAPLLAAFVLARRRRAR